MANRLKDKLPHLLLIILLLALAASLLLNILTYTGASCHTLQSERDVVVRKNNQLLEDYNILYQECDTLAEECNRQLSIKCPEE